MGRNVEKREEFHGQNGGNPHSCRGGDSLIDFLTTFVKEVVNE